MGAESGGKRTSYLGLACEIYLCLKYQLCYYIVKLSQFFFNTSTITVFLETQFEQFASLYNIMKHSRLLQSDKLPVLKNLLQWYGLRQPACQTTDYTEVTELTTATAARVTEIRGNKSDKVYDYAMDLSTPRQK